MNIFATDHATIRGLSQRLRSEGIVVLRDVDLPSTFLPAMTDVVFLPVDDLIELYVSANIRYVGESAHWQTIQRSPSLPGGSRLVARVTGDLNAALRFLQGALIEAGGVVRPRSNGGSDDEICDAPPAECPQLDGQMDTRLRNLVEEARRTPGCFVGRERELRDMMACLLRETKPGVVLVGPAGCGKTTLVEMLARRIAAGEVPDALREVPIFDMPLGALLEDAQFIGHLERQVREVLSTPGRPIFFVDEIHQIVRSELRPLVDILKPSLASGQLRMLGATTSTEWRQLQDKAFRRRFTQLEVSEPSLEETFSMLATRVVSLSEYHRIQFDERDIREAILLSHRYMPDRSFPDKAIDLLDHAAAIQVAAGTADPHSTGEEHVEADLPE